MKANIVEHSRIITKYNYFTKKRQPELMLETMINTLKLDAKANGANSFFRLLNNLFFHSGYQQVLLYRFSKLLLKFGVIGKLLAKIVKRLSSFLFACEISYHTKIGAGLCIPHATGIVIGDKAVIGKNVTIYQNVTIGQRSLEDKNPEYPIIEDNVTIYAGAQIIGGIKIASHSIIGANAVVLSDCIPNSVLVGIPAKALADRTTHLK